jgi:flagellar biosynthesis protein FliR
MPKRFLKYEHRSDPVLPATQWLARLVHTVWLAFFIIVAALSFGVVGYHFIAGLDWVDAILEASMILGGMGAVAPMTTVASKLFASAYSLFSGLIFISVTGVVLAPFMHRMMHHFHVSK